MSFAGTWNIVVDSPMGEQRATLVITETDGKVAGVASMAGDSAPFIDPLLDGDRLRWSQEITRPMSLTLKFDVTCSGDTLKGTAKIGFFATSEVTGTRADSQQ